jgi:hydroxyacylglutathione hydrolase
MQEAVMLEIVTVPTPELGDRSYLAHDGETGVVVDPQRDTDRMVAAVTGRGLRISHVLETHIHNDYVTGGLALARQLGAEYVISAQDRVSYDRLAVQDGDELAAGSLRVQAIATPGHTDHHLSYGVTGGSRQVLFTGGSMLYGATGRTDLLGTELTEALTRSQFRSVRRLAEQFPPDTEVLPTHGFGSFCAATVTTPVDSSTIGRELRDNLALTVADEDTFVRVTVAGLTAYPRYYAHMGYLNLAGPGPVDLSPAAPAQPGELSRRLRAGQWVVDVRSRRAFAAGHLSGSYGIELGNDFATYLGWILPWGTQVTLVADTADQVARAQRDLVRIGIDRVAGAMTAGDGQLDRAGTSRQYPVAAFADLAKRAASGEAPYVLDVRHPDEWREGHLPGAHHVPFEDLLAQVAEVPGDREIWVHCRTGMRASVAASILDAAGATPVLIDDLWEHAAEAGLPADTTAD